MSAPTLITLFETVKSFTACLFKKQIRVNHRIALNFVLFFPLYDTGIHTRLAGKANLTKFLLDKLPWDHVTDLKFIDANANEIAYCNIIQCAITVNKKGNDSSLNWTNRFDVEGGALVLTDIKEADNCREFRIEAHCGSDKGKVHIEKIWILVNTSLGNYTLAINRV